MSALCASPTRVGACGAQDGGGGWGTAGRWAQRAAARGSLTGGRALPGGLSLLGGEVGRREQEGRRASRTAEGSSPE